jgi:predicted GNAT superfamily acetyltransferase
MAADEAIVPVTAADLQADEGLAAALLALNNADAVALSALRGERLRQLVGMAFFAGRIGVDEALLIAMDQDTAYDNQNFQWFRARYTRFVYVDRVVVSAAARGRGHARRLYQDLFARAVLAGQRRIVCEVNAQPPNPASDAFHASFGFALVGEGRIAGAGKTVRYFVREVGGT